MAKKKLNPTMLAALLLGASAAGEDDGSAPDLAAPVNRPEVEKPIKPPRVPSIVERSAKDTVEDAHRAKVNATRDWIEGRITSKQHAAVHKRANHVIKHRGRLAPDLAATVNERIEA